MRIGSTLLLQNGYCYQSYGWNSFRPLGMLQNAVEMLDQYEVDEISIIRPIRDKVSDEELKQDLTTLLELKTLTPISLGGGIRNLNDIKQLSGLPIERLVLSSAFINKDAEVIRYAQSVYGRQAIVACLPFRIANNQIQIFHSKLNSYSVLDSEVVDCVMKFADEVVLYDTLNEGVENRFERSILDLINIPPQKIIISGGIGIDTIQWARSCELSSVLIENRILHRENSIAFYR